MRWDKDRVYSILFKQLQSLFWLDDDEKDKIIFYIEDKRVGGG